MLVNGEWKKSSDGKTTSILDPSNNQPIAEVERGNKDDARAAVDAARQALQSADWREIDPSKRGRMLYKMANLVRENSDELAKLETLNVGKPLRESKGDVAWAARTFEYFAGLADKIEGETIPVPPKRLNYTLREPLGVTVHIVPWNYPVALASRSVAPALATGNSVIIKPSELTPLTALKLGELSLRAGFPKGIVNVVPGPGSEVGMALCADRQVDGIVFTGSAETGGQVMETDAKDGIDEGARLLTGSEKPPAGGLERGNYIQPTIFDDVTPEMKVGSDEIFGPVLSVSKFSTVDEAVAMANNSPYGLYGGVWTSNVKTAHDVASRLQVGVVAVNEYLVTFPQTPFGGYKDSGIGHENGIRSLQYYTRTKNVSVNLA